MGFLNYKYGWFFQIIALVHFMRRRPDNYWLWIILMGGGVGALAYIVVEVLPDMGLLRQSYRVFSHRKRIQQLEMMVVDNPSAGNYEELADLYFEKKRYDRARSCYDKAISSRTDSPDPFYRRALCEIELNDFPAALLDLERVMKTDRNYDYQRAAGMLAYVYSRTGSKEQAAALFEQVMLTSTLSETQFNYACLLADLGRTDEARRLAQTIVAKKVTMPRYLKRRERPWFRRAAGLLKRLPENQDAGNMASSTSPSA